jgi:glycosyltransferase involved in cell wall biosynthesis
MALAQVFEISLVLMRRLIPARFYPGRRRLGKDLSVLTYPPDIKVLDGVDWFWGMSMLRAIAFLRSQRPTFVIFEWWTGAVLHSYLLLAIVARLFGARLIIEFHEVQDVGEQRVPLVGLYVSRIFPLLLRLASASVIHSEHDRAALLSRFGSHLGTTTVLPHAPYDFHRPLITHDQPDTLSSSAITHLLYFGVIRPFKGVDDLVAAFNTLSPDDASRFQLTIIGEPWERFDVRPLVETSKYRDHITLIDHYVHDEELAHHLSRSDVVVLPYRRSSSSGPLSVAMGLGLPVIVTKVGGLVEAASSYAGTLFVEPRDIISLRSAFLTAESLRGRRFTCDRSWEDTTSAITALLSSINPGM